MSRNKVLAILAAVVVSAFAYVMWQRLEPPKPMGPALPGAGGAASSSPTSSPKLGKVQE